MNHHTGNAVVFVITHDSGSRMTRNTTRLIRSWGRHHRRNWRVGGSGDWVMGCRLWLLKHRDVTASSASPATASATALRFRALVEALGLTLLLLNYGL